MKKSFLLLLVCLLAVCAFAGETSVTINSKSNVAGTTIAPGQYKVSYVIKGSTAEVKLTQAGKTVLTTTGNVVENKDASPYNAVVSQTNADGTNSVVEFQFAKQKQVIRIGADTTGAAGK